MLKLPGRKLLVASIGVAAVSYVACGTTTSNTALPPQDAAVDVPTSGNLMGPPDARADSPSDAGNDALDDVSNDTSDGSADASTE